MPGKGRSQKVFVRKHYDSYWKVLGDKWNNESSNKDKGKERVRLEPHIPREPPHRDFEGGNFSEPRHFDHNGEDEDFEPAGDATPAGGVSEARWGGQGGAPAGPAAPGGRFFGDQAQQGRLPSAMPPMSDLRHLQPGELHAHMRRGGQTGYGERVRGFEGPSVYFGSGMPGKQGGGGGERISASGGSRRPIHPWIPETELYEQEKTRQKKREGSDGVTDGG